MPPGYLLPGLGYTAIDTVATGLFGKIFQHLKRTITIMLPRKMPMKRLVYIPCGEENPITAAKVLLSVKTLGAWKGSMKSDLKYSKP